MVRTSKVKMWRNHGDKNGKADGHPQGTSFLRYFVLMIEALPLFLLSPTLFVCTYLIIHFQIPLSYVHLRECDPK